MHFSAATLLSVVLASTALAGPLSTRDGHDDSHSIFKDEGKLWDGAICKNEIPKDKFNLQVPDGVQGGCVRYYRGIDMTGVVTEVNLFFNDGIKSACDCAIKCLEAPLTCTNWVYKHTFNQTFDSGKRSCTMYSSPNLPTDVTLSYNLTGSVDVNFLAQNPQAGGTAPFTFSDKNLTVQDPHGVSGFMTQDANNKQYC